jgi:uncharacterized protein involved in outer membrane biogenesis
VRRVPETPVATVVAILSTIIGLIVLAWAILFITKGRFLKPTFEKYASSAAERQVRVGGDFQLYFAPFRLKFLADELTVTNTPWAPRKHFWESKHLEAWIAPLSLVFGDRYKFHSVALDGANIDLEWDKAGKANTWTFGDPNAKGEPFQLPLIERARIAGTQLRYVDHVLQIFTNVRVKTVDSTNTRIDDAIRFTGDGTMRGKQFTMYGSLLSPNETVSGGSNKLAATANSGGNRLDVSGTLPGATVLEGADLKVSARGPNLARLFDLMGIVVPDTRAYRFTSHLTKAGEEWRFTKLTGGYGDSDLAGKMTISMPNDRVLLVADLSSKSVDIIDIGPFMGYSPERLDAQGGKGAITQVNGTPRLLPDAPLRVESMKIMDAKVKYRVARIRAPNLPVSNVALTLDLDHNLLVLSPLTFDMAGGKVSADISINARVPAVLTDYDIRLSPTPMGKLLAGWGVAESGTTGTMKARIQMKGRGDTVHDSLSTSNGRIAIILPAGTFWTQYIQLAEFDVGTFVQKMFEDKLKKPVQVNCGLIGFTVRNGIATADPILIDTDKNVMLGRGGFSFKDESLDLGFRADAKKISLFSGQSPVGIGGHFAAPSIQIISPQLLARAGAGLGLLAAVAPPAAILAFVDPGDAKSTACGPVLSGARASAQRTVKGEKRDDVKPEAPKSDGEKKKDKKFLGIF